MVRNKYFCHLIDFQALFYAKLYSNTGDGVVKKDKMCNLYQNGQKADTQIDHHVMYQINQLVPAFGI